MFGDNLAVHRNKICDNESFLLVTHINKEKYTKTKNCINLPLLPLFFSNVSSILILVNLCNHIRCNHIFVIH